MYPASSVLSSVVLPQVYLEHLSEEKKSIEEYQGSFLEQLNGKVTRAISRYSESGNLLVFFQKVEKITSLFIVAVNTTQSKKPMSGTVTIPQAVGTKLEELRNAFNKAMNEKETVARTAFSEKRYETALKEFDALLQVVSQGEKSERYYLIQANKFAVLIAQEKIEEAIKTYGTLVSEQIPEQLEHWFQRQKGLLDAYVQQRRHANEQQLKQCQQDTQSAQQAFSGLFKSSVVFSTCRVQLTSIQQTLSLTEQTINGCARTSQSLKTYFQQLGMDYTTECQPIANLHTQCKTLVASALQLISSLETAGSPDDRTNSLCAWLKSNISAYQVTSQNKLPEFHLWVLSMLGSLYSSNTISDSCLDAIVHVFRTNIKVLFGHLHTLPNDVHVSLGSIGVDTSLLLLATISDSLKNTHCSETAIMGLRSKGILSSLTSWAFSSSSQTASLPKIELAPPSQVKNFGTILQGLLNCFQQQGIGAIKNFSAEDTVTLFEVANAFLQMPQPISALLLGSLNTRQFQGSLTAIQWLRLTQATYTALPYSKLKELFPRLTKPDLLAWISLYDPTRIKTDSRYHKILFTCLHDCAKQVLFVQDSSADEARQVFDFLVDLYDELDSASRRPLDMSLITFGWECVNRFPKLAEEGDFEISQNISYFNDEYELPYTEQAKSWFEQEVHPYITELVTTDSNCKAYDHCTELEHLTVNVPEGEEIVSWTHLSRFKKLEHLCIDGGSVVISQLNQLPLQSLTLKNCLGALDFSQGLALQELSLHNVALVKDSLSWIVSSTHLKSVTIEGCNGPIGRLAAEALPHTVPTLEVLVLKDLLGVDEDGELYQSLPHLVMTQTSIRSITFHSSKYENSFCKLIQGASLVEELALPFEPEQLQLLGGLAHLKTVRFFIASQEELEAARETDYRSFQALEVCECINIQSGEKTTIPLTGRSLSNRTSSSESGEQ